MNQDHQIDEGRDVSPLGAFLRGCAMGAADVVPGVSGGTIAFITGIYLRLLSAIGGIPEAVIGFVRSPNIKTLWRGVDGTFLVTLLAGILTSVLLLARLISHWLEAYPVLIWSFFFGLIIAAAWHVGRQVAHWRITVGVSLLMGVALAVVVTELTPAQLTVTPLTLFGAGALAICAMILPGISGSFILLLMGMYAPVIAAVKGLALAKLAIFAGGCVVGLLAFSRVIAWGLRHYQDVMLALLTGFMLGSLNKVWPWKVTTEWRLNSHGEQVPLLQDNIGPLDYASATGADSHLLPAVVLMLGGLLLVLGLEWLGNRYQRRKGDLPSR
ncbi:DUF368 domain-containing protein [Marinobacteraceae bacterium S3BR75-40.1]